MIRKDDNAFYWIDDTALESQYGQRESRVKFMRNVSTYIMSGTHQESGMTRNAGGMETIRVKPQLSFVRKG